MTVEGLRHAVEFRRCLAELDVVAARRLWAHVHPGWDQPDSDDEMLTLLHLARARALTLHPSLRAYSRAWLAERESGGYAKAVGIAVKNAASEVGWLRRRALGIRDAMSDAVGRSLRAGIDIDAEAPEVRRRMLAARTKEIGGGMVGWLREQWRR